MAGVEVRTSTQLVAVKDGKPMFAGPRGLETLDVDQTIISSGFVPTFNPVRDELEARSDTLRVIGIGDCKASRMVMDAVHEGYMAGCNL